MTTLLLLVALNWSPEAQRALDQYRTSPETGLRALQAAAFLVHRTEGLEAALALLDSAYALRPDARLTRWALDLTFQSRDTQRLRRYLFRYPHEVTRPQTLTWVYLRLKTSPWRFLWAEWQDSVRRVLGYDPFGRQHYMEALQRRDYPEALYWLFQVAQRTQDLRWPLRELRRLAPFISLEDAQRVRKTLGEFPGSGVLLSRLYLLKGHREEAYREALRARDPETLKLLAREALAESDVADALRLLQALPKEHRDAEAWLLLARGYRQIGDTTAALEAYRHALPQGRREFLSFLLRLGRPQAVLEFADSTTLDLAAWAHVLQGDTAQAESLARHLTGPTGERLQIQLALLTGDLARADTLIRRFVLHYPQDPWAAEALTLLDLLHADPRLLPEVQRYLWASTTAPEGSTLADTVPSSPAARYLRARTAEAAGQWDIALGLYQELAETDSLPWAALALYRAGHLYRDALHDTLTARTLWQQLVQRFPQSPYAALARSALP